jgi:hypothetical protein
VSDSDSDSDGGEGGPVGDEEEEQCEIRVDRPRQDRRAPAWQSDYVMD